MYLSKSKIATYLQCPMKYFLRYVEQIKTPSSPSMVEGSALHTLIEKAILEGSYTDELLASVSDSFWKDICIEETSYASFEALSTAQKRVLSEARQFLGMLGNDYVAYDVETYMETPLIHPLTGEVNESIILHGYPDLLLQNGESTLLADIKTSARMPVETAALRSVDLDVYGYLLASTFGWQCEISTSLLYLVRTKVPKVAWLHSKRTLADFVRTFETVEQVCFGIENNMFWRSPSIMCSQCPYDGLCYEHSAAA